MGPEEADTGTAGSGAARKLLQLLELVRTTPVGAAVYREAVLLLERLEQDCARAERTYSRICRLFLDRHLESAAEDESLRAELLVLRRQLQEPLLPGDDALPQRLEQLLTAPPDPDPSAAAPDAAGADAGELPTGPADAPAEASRPPAADHIGRVQESLGREIRETLAQSEEFGVLLDLILGELERVRDTGEVQQVKAQLLQQVKRLHAGHYALARKLDSADRYLNMLAVDNQHLNRELTRARELSLTDELTGLPNRRAFLQRLEEEVARVERYGTPLAMAMIDLDGFKGVNDEHGHGVGDDILCCYAQRIFSGFRQHDLVARYGGEEFAVLLPNTDREGAAAALRKAKNRLLSVQREGVPVQVRIPSFSAGVAVCRRGERAAELIQRADEALYRAKRLGRDRVELDVAQSS